MQVKMSSEDWNTSPQQWSEWILDLYRYSHYSAVQFFLQIFTLLESINPC